MRLEGGGDGWWTKVARLAGGGSGGGWRTEAAHLAGGGGSRTKARAWRVVSRARACEVARRLVAWRGAASGGRVAAVRACEVVWCVSGERRGCAS